MEHSQSFMANKAVLEYRTLSDNHGRGSSMEHSSSFMAEKAVLEYRTLSENSDRESSVEQF